MPHTLYRLIPVRLWQSTKPQPQQTLTVVTALSTQRLGMLEAQCRSWPGPLAAVVYEGTVVRPGSSSNDSIPGSQVVSAAEQVMARKLAAPAQQQHSTTQSSRALLSETASRWDTADAERAIQEVFARCGLVLLHPSSLTGCYRLYNYCLNPL